MNICGWCRKYKGITPMVSGYRMAMICKGCGTSMGLYDYKQVRAIFNKYERRIKYLENQLANVGEKYVNTNKVSNE